MAQEKIEIIYDTATLQMMVGAPMSDQAQKDRTILMLISAIKMVVDFKQSVIVSAKALPNGVIPFGNGVADAKKMTN